MDNNLNILEPLVTALYESGKLIFNLVWNNLTDTRTELPKLIEYELPQTRSLKIPIGQTLNNVAYIDLDTAPHTYIVGTTGSGKSVCTKSILTSLINMYSPKTLHLYLGDLKRVELSLFKDVEHTQQFCYKIDDVTKMIQYLLTECEQRYDLFMKNGVTNITDYNRLGRKRLPYKVLFIEEIVLLLQDKKHVGMNLLKQLMPIGRAGGIFIFLTTQRPSADILDSMVKAVIGNRIVFQCEDSKNSIIALDREGAELLTGEGHGILKVGSNNIEFKGYYISDEQTKQLIKPHIKIIEPKVTTKQLGFIEGKKRDNSTKDIDFLDKI